MSGQIESMAPLRALPPMITFAEGGPCEKGETAAKTGCTPASGEGTKKEGNDEEKILSLGRIMDKAHPAVHDKIPGAVESAIESGADASDLEYVGAGMEGIILGSGDRAYKVGRFRSLQNEAEALESLQGTAAGDLVPEFYSYDSGKNVIVREMVEGEPATWGTRNVREAYEAIAEELRGKDWTAPEYKEDSFIQTPDGRLLMVDIGLLNPTGEREVKQVETILTNAKSKEDVDLLDVSFSIRNLLNEGHLSPDQAREMVGKIVEHHGSEGDMVKQQLGEIDRAIREAGKA